MAQAKAHLRVDHGVVVGMLLAAARQHIDGRDYAPSTDSPPDLRANVPAPIKAAILLMLGTLYENRETIVIGQSAVTLPWAAEALLAPFRIFSH